MSTDAQNLPATYADRQWLNPPGHASTGAVAAYHGPSPWSPAERMTYLEIADCHGKIRLHLAATDTLDDFADKMDVLAAAASRFAEHLRAAAGAGRAGRPHDEAPG